MKYWYHEPFTVWFAYSKCLHK